MVKKDTDLINKIIKKMKSNGWTIADHLDKVDGSESVWWYKWAEKGIFYAYKGELEIYININGDFMIVNHKNLDESFDWVDNEAEAGTNKKLTENLVEKGEYLENDCYFLIDYYVSDTQLRSEKARTIEKAMKIAEDFSRIEDNKQIQMKYNIKKKIRKLRGIPDDDDDNLW